LLLLSIVGMFTPTIYYQIYGHFTMSCTNCAIDPVTLEYACTQCSWQEANLDEDPTYNDSARYLQWACAAILPVSYLIGLVFTLKTHVHELSDPHVDSGEDHDAPQWSKTRCVVILLFCTSLFAAVSEALISSLEPSLELLGISQTFAGVTVLALVPSTAEFANAIGFSMKNNFAMSLEIGNSAAVQLALIQVPVLVFFSAIVSPHNEAQAFSLIFPEIDLFAVILSVIIVNYISIQGKANYFLGSAMIICWTLFMCAFWWV
jgi:Ca2+:H+ antiporter